VNHAVHALDGIFEYAGLIGLADPVEVPDLDKVEESGILGPGFDHGLPFC
jgi:hypothetical protein